MASNLSDDQLNINCYKRKILNVNLMVTTNQQPVVDMQRIKEKQSKCITKKSLQTMKETQRRKDQIKITKQPQNK